MLNELVSQIDKRIDKAIRNIHTAIPGRIVSVDTSACRCTVQPVMRYKLPTGKTIAYPQISGVPIVFPQAMGQNTTIAYPVSAGDSCLLIISEQSLDFWMYGQETSTDLAYDLTNAICIPGLFTSANSAFRDAIAEGSVIIRNGSQQIKVGTGGIYLFGNVKVNGQNIVLQ